MSLVDGGAAQIRLNRKRPGHHRGGRNFIIGIHQQRDIRAANADGRCSGGQTHPTRVVGPNHAGHEAQSALQEAERGIAGAHVVLVVVVLVDAKRGGRLQRGELAVLKLDHDIAVFTRVESSARLEGFARPRRGGFGPGASNDVHRSGHFMDVTCLRPSHRRNRKQGKKRKDTDKKRLVPGLDRPCVSFHEFTRCFVGWKSNFQSLLPIEMGPSFPT